ncbi:MAG: tetratricopeptide repeat protein [Chitinophagaceae bacterium]|nr:MAG: tetratricopeptide repeat protein [Chitinophagaceae bacterium]
MIKLKRGWKRYNIIIGFIVINCYSQTSFILKENLDFDKSIDTLKYSVAGGTLKGQIITSDKHVFFELDNDPDLGTQIILTPGEITLFTGGNIAGAAERESVYSYDQSSKNWVYSRHFEINHNNDNGSKSPEIEFSYREGESATIDGKKVHYVPVRPMKSDLGDLVLTAKKGSYDGRRIIEYIFTYPVNKKNVEGYNNLAYFLKGDDLALYILESIIKEVPDRVVTYLNLADSYYEMGNEAKAKENYSKYIKLMKKEKKDLGRIPKYVYARII